MWVAAHIHVARHQTMRAAAMAVVGVVEMVVMAKLHRPACVRAARRCRRCGRGCAHSAAAFTTPPMRFRSRHCLDPTLEQVSVHRPRLRV